MLTQNILTKPAAAAMRRVLRRFIGSGEEGTGGIAAVEFAMIAPILVLMMIGTVDFGMGFYRKMQVADAAQAGAQYAMAHAHEVFDSTKISTAITSATSPSSKNSWSIAASPAPCQFCGCTASPGVTTAVCPGPPPITIASVTKTNDTAPSCSSRCPDGTVAGTYVTASAQATYNTMLSYPTIRAIFPLSAQTTVRIQ